MFNLLILVAAGISAISAIEYPLLPSHGPALYQPPALIKSIVKAVEVEAPAHYDFSYSVRDDHTGDIKSQTESRKGDIVHGQYTLVDADGFLRTVDYTSDAHNGFNAVVRRDPLGHKVVKAIAPAKILAPIAPLVHYPAPLAYAAPKILAPKIAVGPALAHVSVQAPTYSYQH